VTESKQFRIRSDVQGRQTEDAPSVSALHVEKLLASEIREWLAAPRTLLQLTCGDTRFTVTAAEQPPQTPARSRTEAADDTANDLVTEQSEESFPASDPPSSTGTATGPGRR
jgi:hypothetical protein